MGVASLNFEKYDAEQRLIARKYAPSAVKGGYVEHAERIYSDIDKSSRLAYYRRGTPLLPMLFLYNQVVVFIPPVSKAEVENRFGITWDLLLDFIERKIIITIIGYPAHYGKGKHFNELFEHKPASVWSRGDELALEFANGRDYWKQANQLISKDDFVNDTFVMNRFMIQFSRLGQAGLISKIEKEVKTNYVDLCIFGYEPMATSLMKKENHGWGVRRILELSERIVYPSLIGLGGTPNYGLNSIASSNLAMVTTMPEIKNHGPELEVLTNGLSLTNITTITPDLIIDFHKDNMSKKLWAVLDTLEEAINSKVINLNDLTARALIAQNIIEDAMQCINGVNYQTKRTHAAKSAESFTGLTTKLLPVFPIATMFWGPFDQNIADATLAATQVVAYLASCKHHERAIEKCEEMISNTLMSKYPGIANQLWWISDWTKQRL